MNRRGGGEGRKGWRPADWNRYEELFLADRMGYLGNMTAEVHVVTPWSMGADNVRADTLCTICMAFTDEIVKMQKESQSKLHFSLICSCHEGVTIHLEY